MSAASPEAYPATTTPASPWGTSATTTAAPKSPTMQEILDEQLACQLAELELQHAAELVQKMPAQAFPIEFLSEDNEENQVEDDEVDCVDEDEDVDNDYYDEADEIDDLYALKASTTRGMGSRRRGEDNAKLRLAGSFDDRTKFVLGKLAGRGILNAVDSRIHASGTSLVHHGSNLVAVDDSDEKALVHYAVKILKASAIDAQKTSESLQRSNRPANEEMMWMSVRRQLKIQMDREYSALVRAVAAGVRAPAPLCSWEHVLVMAIVGSQTKAAPRLRDVTLNKGQLAQSYVDLLSALRAMYQKAKLVHGGLSDYSILYHNDACWITDFSGAIDTCHAEHEEALTRDIAFVHDFFASCGMPKASKHSVGILHERTMREVITEATPGNVLSAFPWLKPYLYNTK